MTNPEYELIYNVEEDWEGTYSQESLGKFASIEAAKAHAEKHAQDEPVTWENDVYWLIGHPNTWSYYSIYVDDKPEPWR